MIGNFVSNLKSRLRVARVADEAASMQRNLAYSSVVESKSPSMLNKLLNASYSLVSQHQDDAFCNDNLFMLPRVYSHGNNDDSIQPCRSPISLQAPEKTLDELDNIVDKFVRCITIESGGGGGGYNNNNSTYDGNVQSCDYVENFSSAQHTLNWLMNFIFLLICRGEMIVKRSAGDWQWERRMTI